MPNEIEPKNLTAQLAYRGRGNPISTHVSTAISNCFPGLETDFRNVWRHLFAGLEFHEATNQVLRLEPGSAAAQAGVTTDHFLVSVGGSLVRGPNVMATLDTIEWNNAVADVLLMAGQVVTCRFEGARGEAAVEVPIQLQSLFEGITLSEAIAGPGELTQSLCSPWQSDYRECACFYWAANRPDFVNVEVSDAGTVGHNWLDKTRQPGQPKRYVEENFDNPPPELLTYDDLYQRWERELRFQIGGQDSE
jgi:hypothetical protein